MPPRRLALGWIAIATTGLLLVSAVLHQMLAAISDIAFLPMLAAWCSDAHETAACLLNGHLAVRTTLRAQDHAHGSAASLRPETAAGRSEHARRGR